MGPHGGEAASISGAAVPVGLLLQGLGTLGLPQAPSCLPELGQRWLFISWWP